MDRVPVIVPESHLRVYPSAIKSHSRILPPSGVISRIISEPIRLEREKCETNLSTPAHLILNVTILDSSVENEAPFTYEDFTSSQVKGKVYPTGYVSHENRRVL